LSTDFYFSYTYDLSRTLQENALGVSDWPNFKNAGKADATFHTDSKFIWNRYLLEPLRANAVSEQWIIEMVHGYVGLFTVHLFFILFK
uniref:SAC domain-containing protein n=1 Tax=Gongylonema pulchrum TaxID=637853 RepID=A0A183DMJ0_9BILA